MARKGLISENETLTEDKIIKWLESEENIQAPGDNSRKYARQYELGGRRPDFALEIIGEDCFVIIEAKHKDHDAGCKQAKEYLELAKEEGSFNNIIALSASLDIKKKVKLSAFALVNGILEELDAKKQSVQYLLSQIKKSKEGVSVKKKKVKGWRELLRAELANLHEYVRNYCKSPFNEKINLLNGIFIALRSEHFVQNMNKYRDEDYSKEIYAAINAVMHAQSYDKEQRAAVTTAFKFLDVDGYPSSDPSSVPTTLLKNPNIKEPTVSFCKFASNYIQKFIIEPLKKDPEFGNSSQDISSVVYNEFIKYAKGDGKDLGIVLTPEHVCDLMTELLELKPDDVVLDICTGSGAFLVSTMNKKLAASKTPEEEHESLKGLVGVELQPSMYALAVANMLFNGADLSALYMGSCYEQGIINKIKQHQPTKAILNPPYSMCKTGDMKDLHEWAFILHALSFMPKGGKLACIIPKSCGIKNEELNLQLKELIMQDNTLDIVVACNDQLFYPTGTNVNIYVFTAGVPHGSVKTHLTVLCDYSEDGFKISRGVRIPTSEHKEILAELMNNLDKLEINDKLNMLKFKYTDEWDFVHPELKPEITDEELINALIEFYNN